MSGAASSSTIFGFQGLPQKPSSQRTAMALFSHSFDIMDSLDLILCQEVVCKLPGCLPNSDVSVGQHSGSCRQIHKKAPRSPWRAIFDFARAGVLALLDASRGRRATLERAA